MELDSDNFNKDQSNDLFKEALNKLVKTIKQEGISVENQVRFIVASNRL